MKRECLSVLEQMKRNCNIIESDVLNSYFVDTLGFIDVLREQISILEKEITKAKVLEQKQEEQEVATNRRNTQYADTAFIVSVYKGKNFNIKKTLEALHQEGVSISDKQLRNKLKKAGVYEGRKGEQ